MSVLCCLRGQALQGAPGVPLEIYVPVGVTVRTDFGTTIGSALISHINMIFGLNHCFVLANIKYECLSLCCSDFARPVIISHCYFTATRQGRIFCDSCSKAYRPDTLLVPLPTATQY